MQQLVVTYYSSSVFQAMKTESAEKVLIFIWLRSAFSLLYITIALQNSVNNKDVARFNFKIDSGFNFKTKIQNSTAHVLQKK